MKKIFKIQSVSDIITNSSSEAFMLDSTKLSQSDLKKFNNAINKKHAGIDYVNDYIKNCPYDIIEFVNLIDLSIDDIISYEKEFLNNNTKNWNFEHVEKFLHLHNKSLNDFSNFMVIYDFEIYSDDSNELVAYCRNINEENAILNHTYCF